MKNLRLLLLSAIFGVALVSCNEDLSLSDLTVQDETDNYGTSVEKMYCGTQSYTLWAGQTINAGTLVVSNDADSLYVTYTTAGSFQTLHLWVGTDLSNLPMNNNSTPVPGKFPYKFDTDGLSTYTFAIALDEIASLNDECDKKIFVVAHAEVNINGKDETAFGGNKAVNVKDKGRWYYYAEYIYKCCDNDVDYQKLGTAFAKGGYVFVTKSAKSNPEGLPTLGLTNNRWGWAIKQDIGVKSYDLYVGAGLNDISKGIKVGYVEVDFNGTSVKVTYMLDEKYSIEEAHIYCSATQPTTIAPGQYGNPFYFNPFVKELAKPSM